jgi:hypothetical protein
MALLNQANAIYIGSTLVDRVYLGTTQVWPPLLTTYSAMQFSAIFTALQVISTR